MYNFEEQLKNIIISCGKNKNITCVDINYETDLINDLSFDSLDIILLIVEIEGNFCIEIEDEDLVLDKLSSYYNLCKMINQKLIENA